MKQFGVRPASMRLLLLVMFCAVLVVPLLAGPPSGDRLGREFKLEAARLVGRLGNLGRMPVEALPEILPSSLRTFQAGYFNVDGEYMSEVVNITRFAEEAHKFLAQVAGTGLRYDFSDLLVALFQTSPNRRQAAANGYLVIDYFIHSHCSPSLLKGLTGDGSSLVKHLEARRLFSDLHMMLSQLSYLKLPQVPPKPAKEPPGFVKAIIAGLKKLPGQRGKAIEETLAIVGIEDLTAAIFTNHAMARLQDPIVRDRILQLYDEMIVQYKQMKGAGRATGRFRNLWEVALGICGGPGPAFELLGVFTTQHRTLPKTILPRLKTKEEQFPLLPSLIRTSSNFFLVQELNWLSPTPQGEFVFSYPKGFESDDPRFYHFWSEAFIGWHLLEKGFSPDVVRFVTRNLGRAYELYTIPANMRFAIKSEAELKTVFSGFRKDVISHRQGAEFAISVWESLQNPKSGK